jgi:hypothetical protein
MLRRSMLAGILLLMGACGSASDADTAAPTTTSSTAAHPDIDVVRAHVEAMADEDLDGANALRCGDAVIAPADVDLVADQLDRFLEANGALGFSRGEVVEDPPGFDALEGMDDPVVVRYWPTFDGEETAEPLFVFVGSEDGERRICGYGQARAVALTDATDGTLVDLGPTTRTLEELVDVAPPDGFTVTEVPGDDRPDTGPQPVDTAVRSFLDDSGYGGLSVVASRFATPEDAREAAAAGDLRALGDGVDVLTDPSGIHTIEIAGYSWTFAQPADTWPVVTRTVLAYDDVVVVIRQGALAPGDPDPAWQSVVDQVQALASAPG